MVSFDFQVFSSGSNWISTDLPEPYLILNGFPIEFDELVLNSFPIGLIGI